MDQMLDLKKVITYQEGAVVSKEMVKTDCGSVTLFAFAKGQEISDHMTPYEAFIHIIEGEAVVTTDGQSYTALEGNAFHLPAGRLHSLKSVKPFKMVLTMIRS